jgi:hypothetical protein
MVVDYSTNGHVCEIQLPTYGSGKAGATPADELISDLIPFALRGKEKGRGIVSLGLSFHIAGRIREPVDLRSVDWWGTNPDTDFPHKR